jgi:hypothetical protein
MRIVCNLLNSDLKKDSREILYLAIFILSNLEQTAEGNTIEVL